MVFKKGNIPWNRGIARSERTKKKISEANKNPSIETRKKMSDSHKGQVSWSKGKIGIYSEETKRKMSAAHRGVAPWNKGLQGVYKHLEESRQRISDAQEGRPAWNKGLPPEQQPRWGTHLSKETKEKIGNANRGRPGPMRGKNHSKNAKSKMSVARKGKLVGEENPNWHGGKSFEPYGLEFNGSLKERVKKRDNYTCQICGTTKSKFGTHHIDYDKKNNSEENLVCLCNRCHGKTNFNRDSWKAYFKELLTGASEAAVGALVDGGLG